MKQILYIITGLPYAGKTTLTKELVKRFGFVISSVDEMLHNDQYIVENMTQNDWDYVYAQAFKNLKKHLTEGKNVIFDGASLLKSERETLNKIAEQFGVKHRLIYVNTPADEIKHRQLKNQQTKVRGHVKDITLEKAFGMFEEPTSDENLILYNASMNLDSWIKKNINI